MDLVALALEKTKSTRPGCHGPDLGIDGLCRQLPLDAAVIFLQIACESGFLMKWKDLKLLVVDDHLNMRKTIANMLKSHGFQNIVMG